MATTNRSCNLECVKNKGEGEVIEFVGPVKIVLVDQPPNIYRRRVWGAAFIVLAQMMMGATTMILLFYAFVYDNDLPVALHIIFCTLGYQMCVPSGILSLNKQNGSAAPMRIPDRQFEHMFLQIVGVSLAVVATMMLFSSGAFVNLTLHSFVGMVAGILAIATVVTGILLYKFFGKPPLIERFVRFSALLASVHKILGSVTFVLSSMCFVLGIMRPRFQEWVPATEMIGFLLLFCAFYTAIVLYRPLLRIMTKVF